MSEARNEAARLLDEWFDVEVDRAWRQLRADERSDDLVAGDMDAGERRVRTRAVLSAHAAHRVELLQEAHRLGRFNVEAARAINAKLDAPMDEGEHRFALLAAEASRAESEIEAAREQWAEGRLEYRPSWRPALDPGAFPVPVPVEIPAAAAPVAPIAAAVAPPAAADTSPRLVAAIDEHMALIRRQTRATVKDLGQREAHLSLLVEAFGGDRRIGTITRREAGEFWSALRELPPMAARMKELKKLTFWPRIEKLKRMRATNPGLKHLKSETIAAYLSDVRTMFGDYVKMGVIDRNPFEGMAERKSAGGGGGEERAWTNAQQDRIFRSPLFMGCAAERDVFTAGDHLLNDWRFWTPLIAATTGARVGEIAQLTPADVACDDDGVWHYRFSGEGGKRIKNEHSWRRVPTHSELIRLGMLKLAETRKLAGAEKLLPDVPPPMNGVPSQQITRWAREVAWPKLVPDRIEGQGWHSWRHCFQDASRAADNPDSTTDRLAGRSARGAGAGYGRYPLVGLRNALEKMRFPAALAEIPARFESLPTIHDHGA